MKRSIWKNAFFVTLAVFLLLSVSLVVLALVKASQGSTIGGAGLPTISFHFSLLLRSPIGYVHTAALILTLASFIGWRVAKK